MNKKEILMYRALILLLCLAVFALCVKLAHFYSCDTNEGKVDTSDFDPTFEIVSSTADSISLRGHSDLTSTLTEAMESRRTERSFSDKELNDQQIADLLWNALGVNREDGRRTAPTARNAQEIDLYLFTKAAIYRYCAESNSLKLVKTGDYRTKAGTQPFYGMAPLAIAIVADFNKLDAMNFDEAGKQFYSATDAGYVSQNIYLYCAASGLATVACGSVDRESLIDVLGLTNAKAVLSHPIGYPANVE